MTGNNELGGSINNGLTMLEDEIMHSQSVLNSFVKNYMQEYRNMAFETQVQISDLVTAHGTAMIDQEKKHQEAVAESAKTEEERNEVLEDAIELEADLIEVQEEREEKTKLLSESNLKNLKEAGAATLAAYNSISNSMLEMKRKEAEEKKAIINKELEHTISALNKERERRLIDAGFAVENNAQSLEAQLEDARRMGDAALVHDLEKRIQEKEINDEFDRLEEEANKEAAKKQAKLDYDIAKQEHAQKLINAVTSGALAIVNAFKSAGNPILGAVFAGLAAAAVGAQIAAIRSNPPTMPSFSTGGIVPGSSFSGDRVLASLNSREGVFTLADQEYLFDQIQSHKLGGGGVKATIIVNLDSREIAKSTIDLVNDGFYTIKARAIR